MNREYEREFKHSVVNCLILNGNIEVTRYTHGWVSVNKPAIQLSRVYTRMPPTYISQRYFQALVPLSSKYYIGML